MLRLGLIGYGNVGKAFEALIASRSDMKLVVYANSRGIFYKVDGAEDLFEPGADAGGLIDPERIDLLIELSPTNLETGEPALSWIRKALSFGIPVVTGNKGPVVRAYDELKKLAEFNHTYIGIGCTTGGALPSIVAGTEGILGARLTSFEGVLNGTSNYILSEMEASYSSGSPETYQEILEKAIGAGIAEANPAFDVEGYDTAVKMLILSNLIYGEQGYAPVELESIRRKGITDITLEEMSDALREGERIKLVGTAKPDRKNMTVEISVEPVRVGAESPLYGIHRKNKGVVYHTDTMGDIVISGGASSPTGAAAAILRDILHYQKL